MIVELIENQISIPIELLAELEVESGQKLHLSVANGVLQVCPAALRPVRGLGEPQQAASEYRKRYSDALLAYDWLLHYCTRISKKIVPTQKVRSCLNFHRVIFSMQLKERIYPYERYRNRTDSPTF